MAYCTVCNAFTKIFSACLGATKYVQGGQKELDDHLKALRDIANSREDHLASHAVMETDRAPS